MVGGWIGLCVSCRIWGTVTKDMVQDLYSFLPVETHIVSHINGGPTLMEEFWTTKNSTTCWNCIGNIICACYLHDLAIEKTCLFNPGLVFFAQEFGHLVMVNLRSINRQRVQYLVCNIVRKGLRDWSTPFWPLCLKGPNPPNKAFPIKTAGWFGF